LILAFFEKKPDWSKFTEYYFADGRKVCEVHLSNLSGIMPVEFSERYGKYNNELIEESLLLVVETNNDRGFTVLVARYYTFGAKPKGMTYHQIPEGWNGQIDIFSFAERHLPSLKIEEGKLISHTRYQTVADKESSRKYSAFTSCERGCWQDFTYHGFAGGVSSTASVRVVERNVVSGGGGSGIPTGGGNSGGTGPGNTGNPPGGTLAIPS
jgi:hypothetical protein